MEPLRRIDLWGALLCATMVCTPSGFAQRGARDGQWHLYGGDSGSTRYSPLDEINEKNVKDLQIVWRWKAQNFGRKPDFNWEVTPLMVNGVLYLTAGTRRDTVAIDATTGETLWMHRLDEGQRGELAVRMQNRGLSYWTDGRGDERIVMISPGYQLVALNAKTGRRMPGFGDAGIVDLFNGLDRAVVKPGEIGSSSPAMIVGDVVVVGGSLLSGNAPKSKTNVPGYVRGYDVRTGKRLWTFRTIPQAGEFGNDTWKEDSWKYTGNTGVWAPMSADQELGYVYLPVESPTGDYYGGHRPGNNLFAESLVCLDARTGKRVWHYQLVHHGIWDWDVASPPILADITVNGKKIRAVAQVTKQAFVFVFDRVTGEPVWPIEERPVPQSDVPGERTSPTQPFPTKPKPFDRQGVTLDDLIDFTPAIKAEAVKVASQYRIGPMFTPPSIVVPNGNKGTLSLPSNVGGANWQGGAFDPETGILYVPSITNAVPLSLFQDKTRSDMEWLARGTLSEAPSAAGSAGARRNFGPQGLPLIKPPWGRITAIDLNTGDHVWMAPNGPTPEFVRNHPALKGVELGATGQPERAPLLVTKTLLFAGDGAGLFSAAAGAGGTGFRALDKKTGKVIHEMQLPANETGIPMTYSVDGRQYIVVAIGAAGVPAELIALAVP
jgi:quinoprotein glucose dehydrogenase